MQRAMAFLLLNSFPFRILMVPSIFTHQRDTSRELRLHDFWWIPSSLGRFCGSITLPNRSYFDLRTISTGLGSDERFIEELGIGGSKFNAGKQP